MKKQHYKIITCAVFLCASTLCFGQKHHEEKSEDKPTTPKEIPKDFPIFDQQLDSIEQFVITTPVKPKTRFQLFMLGEHHQPVYLNQYKFPVLDLGTYKGGLEIVKKGGGKQTNSLRLATADNQEYVMRSITKDVTRGIPYPFNQMALVTYLFRDNYLGSHPFAPLAIPTLADAVSVYHANPGLYFIPKQPKLGGNNDLFGNEVYLVEERASKKWPQLASFGNAEKFVSTPDLAEKLVKNHKHQVDQNWVARSRLFDVLIGDFDRHDDQWRWTVTTLADDQKLYRPVPRDRDQAFSKYDGFVVKLLAPYNALLRQLSDYEEPVDNFKWATYNSRHFDHNFLNELPLEAWKKEAAFIQDRLTDSVITEAFSNLPSKVYAVSAAPIIAALKARRADLQNIAEGMYRQLAKEVSVVGTDKKEYFEVVRQDDEYTAVTVFSVNKKGEKKEKLYHRLFKTSETKHVYLYGLGDADIFRISGEVNKSIRLEVVGGTGEDQFTDESTVKGLAKKDRFYDSKTGNLLQLNSEGKNKTSDNELHNTYDRLGNQYDENIFLPFPQIGVNIDDGFILGFSGIYTVNGFNKKPYGQRHTFSLNYAFATQGLSFRYGGEFIESAQKWDLVVNTELRNNRYALNFFGFGNESEQLVDNLNFYRVRQSLFYVDAGWQKRLANNRGRFSIRPLLLKTAIQSTPNRFIARDDNGLEPADFEERWYSGATSSFAYVQVDNEIAPRDGFRAQTQVTWHKNLSGSERQFTTYGADMSFYKSFGEVHKLTLASRLGADFIGGNYDFFFAPTLGQQENMRGMFRQRFRGDASLYHLTDLRQELGSSNNIILPFSFGVIASFDHGRVWQEGEDSNVWHYSYGGGFWLAPLNIAVLSFHYNRSDVDSRFMIRMGHAF
ncbi:MAG: hypothetical protein AAGJ18_02660 [Bacteroidota bacterium]